jgi:hypothetical protein
MKNYGDWKTKNSSSAIMEALNRGAGNNTASFGSVDQFLSGLLGQNFIKEKPQITEEPPVDQPVIRQEIPVDYRPEEKIDLVDEEIPEPEEEDSINDEDSTDGSFYKIFRDKEEIFECNISVQGAKLSSSQVRLIFDHEICNLVFYGKINKDGKCAVPLKKMNFYPEKSTGRVRLEVIVEDTVFVPWEETFIVEGAKKVTVQIKSQKKVDFTF